ncbi:DUF1090 family protein [Pantoea sp. S61]|uniref:DUF1090 family protein n=1 Tax=Pantoea sp. S61 TaxID=2767442 RepID=UPI00190C4483|nr:DUF1090 family protein [Pantoea sp. S61]MBK0126284.1 DUF1090 family protein [Pantoea sp. S61]
MALRQSGRIHLMNTLPLSARINIKIRTASLFTLVMMAAVPAYAEKSCEVRRTEMTQALQLAEQHQHVQKEAGLRKALDELNAHCTHAGTLANTRHELVQLDDKISEKQQSIKEIQQEIDLARAKEDTKKINKLQRKLSHKNDELLEAQQKRAEVNSELVALGR